MPRIFPHGVPAPRPAADGRKLVEGAAAHARKSGFGPHRDYKKAARVFGGIDATTSTASFTFGKNGKPFFISGPYDDAARIKLVLSTDTHFPPTKIQLRFCSIKGLHSKAS